jgi:hypothetical protein
MNKLVSGPYRDLVAKRNTKNSIDGGRGIRTLQAPFPRVYRVLIEDYAFSAMTLVLNGQREDKAETTQNDDWLFKWLCCIS